MTIPEELVQKHQQAGKIAKEVREEMRRTVCEGIPIIDLCEKAESLIRKKGGKPAFPCNVSINEIAAHYTSPRQDKRTIPENSIVKIDIGVHVDGYIADTAVTICFNPDYTGLVSTAEEALKKAAEILRPGLSMSRFGATIQKTIKTRGFKPISNLTGHLIGRYLIHAGKSLPNVFHISTSRVKTGEIYGVEPFVTVANAAGRVKNGKEAHIFRYSKHRSLKDPYAKRLLNYVKKNFQALPFTERWLQGCVPPSRFKTAFSELLSSKTLISYPVFIEASGKPVAQAEHTILVTKDGGLVLT
ncbi:MAG: type II methionyl aminopeptidase [Candidatus Bathyarchaeota archaeon]|nr:MAG: type II methionyl aminopeptidase [Candidatus Bathyarchaeota archaeon]